MEHTLRYRKKVEKDDDYVKTIKALSDQMEHCIKQNNAIDIYEEYFTHELEDIVVEAPTAKTLNVYRYRRLSASDGRGSSLSLSPLSPSCPGAFRPARISFSPPCVLAPSLTCLPPLYRPSNPPPSYSDPNPVKRTASCLSWYPDDGHKIAVAYSILQFQQMPTDMSIESYIWDVENPNVPDQTIIPSSPLVCLKYNPKDPHILVGGSYNGLLGYWDTRKGPYPVDTTAIEKSHRDPVFNVAWVQSKTGTFRFRRDVHRVLHFPFFISPRVGSEFFSTSTDGQVLWWDIRKLSEPTDTMLLDPEKNGTIVGGTVLDFESTMVREEL